MLYKLKLYISYAKNKWYCNSFLLYRDQAVSFRKLLLKYSVDLRALTIQDESVNIINSKQNKQIVQCWISKRNYKENFPHKYT